jgi:hypothetical protein
METCSIPRFVLTVARVIVRPSCSLVVSSAGLVLGVSMLVMTVPAFAALTGADVYAPPAGGLFAYNSFVPLPIPGAAYVDPVFGETVRRLTADHGQDDLYARNMWWNADATRYVHRTGNVAGKVDAWDVIDVSTGLVTHTGIPFGSFAEDGGFDPIDPDVLYYLVQNRGDGLGEIHRVTLEPNGSWSDTVYFIAPGPLAGLGGSMNWVDAGGRYMLVRYGPEPSVHLYDRRDLTAGPYGNPIDASPYVDAGAYLGLSPDGQYVVGYDSRRVGLGGVGQGVSWKVDHPSRAIASTPNIFWSLCGDHGSFISASDGRNYMITYDCYTEPGLWRVDITNNAEGLDEAQQRALPHNQLLLAYPNWSSFGHVSTVARGPLRDWAFASTEDDGDTFNGGEADGDGMITPWHAYRQEIVAVNVLTGETRRLAHHRSRNIGSDYYSQPRLSSSWDGDVVGFASNFNAPGVVDVYVVPFAPAGIPLESAAMTRAVAMPIRPVGNGMGAERTAVDTRANRGPELVSAPPAGDERGASGDPRGSGNGPAVSTFGQLLLYRGLDDGAREEVRVDRRMEPRGIGEDELAQVIVADHPVLDHFVGVLEDRGHVDDVEVAGVRAEDAPESVIAVPIEGPGGHHVGGLAAEVEALGVVLPELVR